MLPQTAIWNGVLMGAELQYNRVRMIVPEGRYFAGLAALSFSSV
jgi:hypothetical protein